MSTYVSHEAITKSPLPQAKTTSWSNKTTKSVERDNNNNNPRLPAIHLLY